MGLGPTWSQICSRICYISKICKFCIEKDIHVCRLESASLTCKNVIYRSEINAKREPHGIKF